MLVFARKHHQMPSKVNAYTPSICTRVTTLEALVLRGYCNSKLVSGAQERIAITGYPGDECIIIDRFYVDLPYRLQGHGRQLMQLLICKLKTNGSKQIIIKAYTVQGKAFYLKCGFKCMDWGDLHYDLLPEVDMPDYANLSELITSATSCVLGPVRTITTT